MPCDRNRAWSKALERRVGFSRPQTKVGKESAQFYEPAVCTATHLLACTGAALNRTSARNRVGDVIADMPRQNLGAALHAGVFITNEPPKVRECNDFMPQRPIHITDSGLVGFQIESHRSEEHTSELQSRENIVC